MEIANLLIPAQVKGEEVNWTEVKGEEANRTEMDAGEVNARHFALRNGGKRALVPELNGEAVSKSVQQAHSTRPSHSSYFVECSASRKLLALMRLP